MTTGALGADGFVPLGHEACRHCGDLYVEGVLVGGACIDCARLILEQARTMEVVHAVNGRTVVNRPTKSKRRRKRKLTPAERENKRLWNRARSRAIQRLIRLNHPMYEMLLAEEKAKLGLDSRLDVRPPGAGPIEAELREAV